MIINKSRGKRIDNGEWVHGFYWFVPEHSIAGLSNRHFIKSINNGIDYEVIPETVGKFTELLDKKYDEIYEGDVLDVLTFSFDPEHFITDVIWDKCSFKLRNGRNIFYFSQSDFTRKDDAYIIGNIHDNPELLKKPNQ